MKAQQLGYQPEVILAGRRINNNVGPYLAQRLVKMLINQGLPVKGARVGVLGLTFKEDCNDLRNSKVPDILAELREFGIEALIHDSRGNPAEAKHEYGLTLNQLEDYRNLDGLIVAVSHKEYIAARPAEAARHGARQRLLRRRQERLLALEDGARHPVLELVKRPDRPVNRAIFGDLAPPRQRRLGIQGYARALRDCSGTLHERYSASSTATAYRRLPT